MKGRTMKQRTEGQKRRTKKRLHDLATGRLNAPNIRHGQNVLMMGQIQAEWSAYKQKRRAARRKRIEARIADFKRKRQCEHRAQA